MKTRRLVRRSRTASSSALYSSSFVRFVLFVVRVLLLFGQQRRAARQVADLVRRLLRPAADHLRRLLRRLLRDVLRQPAPRHLTPVVGRLALQRLNDEVEEDAVALAKPVRLERPLAAAAA